MLQLVKFEVQLNLLRYYQSCKFIFSVFSFSPCSPFLCVLLFSVFSFSRVLLFSVFSVASVRDFSRIVSTFKIEWHTTFPTGSYPYQTHPCSSISATRSARK